LHHHLVGGADRYLHLKRHGVWSMVQIKEMQT
jgi:hypothetical protein